MEAANAMTQQEKDKAVEAAKEELKEYSSKVWDQVKGLECLLNGEQSLIDYIPF